jgi:hypothetical protein
VLADQSPEFLIRPTVGSIFLILICREFEKRAVTLRR